MPHPTTSKKETLSQLRKEFDRQVENLLQKGYPKLAGQSQREFLRRIQPLREKVGKFHAPEINLEKGRLPFVVVVKSDLVPAEKAMSLEEREGK